MTVVSGAGSHANSSDVYSLAKMVNCIPEKTGLVLSAAEFVNLVRLALSEDSEARPKLTGFLCIRNYECEPCFQGFHSLLKDLPYLSLINFPL